MGLGAAAIVARIEEIIIAASPDHPRALDQTLIFGRILGRDGRHQIDRRASKRERNPVRGQLLDLDRPEARTPVEQTFAGYRVVEAHRIDIDEARAALE